MWQLRDNMIAHRLRLWLVSLLTCVLWIAQAPLAALYYERTASLGYYRPEADSIAIPIAGTAVTSVMFAPALMVVLWLIMRRFPRVCSWLAWSKAHLVWSVFWTLLWGFLNYSVVVFLLENLRLGLWLNALANISWVLIWCEMRAIIVSKLDWAYDPTS